MGVYDVDVFISDKVQWSNDRVRFTASSALGERVEVTGIGEQVPGREPTLEFDVLPFKGAPPKLRKPWHFTLRQGDVFADLKRLNELSLAATKSPR
jgi:hypothetical protein